MVWHANVYPVMAAAGPEWHGRQLFCLGVPHQPLRVSTGLPSAALPNHKESPFVGLRPEQAFSRVPAKADRPVSPKDKVTFSTKFVLAHEDHDLEPSPCAKRGEWVLWSTPAVVQMNNPDDQFSSRALILADAHNARPFGISNQNEVTRISMRLVDANNRMLQEEPCDKYILVEGHRVKCTAMIKNFVVTLFQSHSVVAEVFTTAYVLELASMPPTQGSAAHLRWLHRTRGSRLSAYDPQGRLHRAAISQVRHQD
jgi:hypothetical protein